jgi:hypothetical protein
MATAHFQGCIDSNGLVCMGMELNRLRWNYRHRLYRNGLDCMEMA